MKVMIVEDDVIVAEDIRQTLVREGYEVTGVAVNCDNGMKLFQSVRPDLIICDIQLEDRKTGIDLVKLIQNHSFVHVVFVTGSLNSEYLRSLSRMKNIMLITKPFTKAQLLSTVSLVKLKILLQDVSKILSNREFQVAELIVSGMKTKEIAHALNISVETVKSHRKQIFSKLDLHSVSQLSKRFMQENGG